jgi:hypothetical protein
MAPKKPVVVNPLNYLGIPAGQSPSMPAPTPKPKTPVAPLERSLGGYGGGVATRQTLTAADRLAEQLRVAQNTAAGTIKNLKDQSTTLTGSMADLQFGKDTGAANTVKAAGGTDFAAGAAVLKGIQDDPEYKVLAQKFASYGMADFPDLYLQVSIDYPKADAQTLQDLLKTDKKYNTDAQGNAKGYAKRFAGNAALVKAGKIPLDDAEYIKAESEYEKTFKGYGLPATMLNKETYAKLIGNEISADEATTRVKLGYDNLKSNAKVLQAFQTFYPQLSQGDIVAAMLNPNEQLPALQRKVAAAEIGGAALRQNLQTSEARAMELKGLGVTQATAEKGYGKIATYLTDAQKLAQIGKEEAFTQTTAEQSQIEGLASAQRKEAQLAEKEVNRFSSQVGAARGAFSRNTTF